ncbi:MAG: hypothetical protein E6R13_03935 [Spirochaetes bacterium]|nr:MAG: hypothetical protein E6R13_03935 [Spirochaetota bacterium]
MNNLTENELRGLISKSLSKLIKEIFFNILNKDFEEKSNELTEENMSQYHQNILCHLGFFSIKESLMNIKSEFKEDELKGYYDNLKDLCLSKDQEKVH